MNIAATPIELSPEKIKQRQIILEEWAQNAVRVLEAKESDPKVTVSPESDDIRYETSRYNLTNGYVEIARNITNPENKLNVSSIAVAHNYSDEGAYLETIHVDHVSGDIQLEQSSTKEGGTPAKTQSIDSMDFKSRRFVCGNQVWGEKWVFEEMFKHIESGPVTVEAYQDRNYGVKLVYAS
jgi:hypothetical protein